MLYVSVVFEGFVCSAEGSDEASTLVAFNRQLAEYGKIFNLPNKTYESFNEIVETADKIGADGWIITNEKRDAHEFLEKFLETE